MVAPQSLASRKLVIGVVVFLLLLSIGGITFFKHAFNNYEVIDKGQLLSYSEGQIYHIRFFEKYDVFLEPENRPNSDLIMFYFLLGTGFVSIVFFFILGLSKRVAKSKVPLLFLCCFFGMHFLAFDEFLGIHESIGHNMTILARLPLVKRPDDAIIILYLIPCSIFGLIFYKEFFECKSALYTGIGAFLLISLAAVSDLLTLPFEELLEIFAGMLIFSSILFLGLYHLDQVE